SYHFILNELKPHYLKRLLITPARVNQEVVHLRFFQSDDDDKECIHANFIGTIELTNIPVDTKKETDRSVTLIFAPGINNSLKIHAKIGKQGAEQEFVLNIEAQEKAEADGDAADADWSQEEQEMGDGDGDGDGDADWSQEEQGEMKPLSARIIAVLSILAVCIIIALAFLFFRMSQNNTVPPLESLHAVKKIALLSSDFLSYLC
ncbi:MAG: hypothetical protein ACR2PY_03750, partial [Salinispira sp.]